MVLLGLIDRAKSNPLGCSDLYLTLKLRPQINYLFARPKKTLASLLSPALALVFSSCHQLPSCLWQLHWSLTLIVGSHLVSSPRHRLSSPLWLLHWSHGFFSHQHSNDCLHCLLVSCLHHLLSRLLIFLSRAHLVSIAGSNWSFGSSCLLSKLPDCSLWRGWKAMARQLRRFAACRQLL